jgi:hypothetical protein
MGRSRFVVVSANFPARGATEVTDIYPGAVRTFLRWLGIISELAPSILMEMLQEGVPRMVELEPSH